MLSKINNIKDFINIYVIFHKPYIEVSSEIFTPILCKSNKLNENLNMISADTGDNIANLNNLYAEFSTFYWVWKNNLTSKYIGFFQYRRYLSLTDNLINQKNNLQIVDYFGWNYDNAVNIFKENDILITQPNFFNGINIKEQYCCWHDIYYLEKSLEIIKNKYPDYIEDCDKALSKSSGYFCNLFIMRRDIFHQYMSFIMDIFQELELCIKSNCQYKLFAYIGERLFNCYIEHLRNSTNLRIKEVPRIFVGLKDNGNINFLVGNLS